MSTGARRIARLDARSTAIAATMTVSGRRIARITSHMSASRPAIEVEELLDIAGGVRTDEQRAPDLEACDRVVDLGLLEQALRLRDLVGGDELRLVARGRLLLGFARGFERDRRGLGDSVCAVDPRVRLGEPAVDRLADRSLASSI